MIALVKTQGSDTKLVAQMQPYYEARGLGHCELAGRSVPPLVTQIADGENGVKANGPTTARSSRVAQPRSSPTTSDEDPRW